MDPELWNLQTYMVHMIEGVTTQTWNNGLFLLNLNILGFLYIG